MNVPQAPPTDEELAWLKKAEEARFSELETIRTSAKDWASTITAVTGALGIFSLIKGPEEIGRLTDGWQAAVGIVLLLAVLYAMRAIVLGALAAQESPRHHGYSPSAYRSYYRDQMLLAARQLQASRFGIVFATLAIVAAVGMTWYGEEASKPGTQVMAFSKGGVVTCGSVTVGKDGFLLIQDGDATPVRVDPAEVLTLLPTGECPE